MNAICVNNKQTDSYCHVLHNYTFSPPSVAIWVSVVQPAIVGTLHLYSQDRQSGESVLCPYYTTPREEEEWAVVCPGKNTE